MHSSTRERERDIPMTKPAWKQGHLSLEKRADEGRSKKITIYHSGALESKM